MGTRLLILIYVAAPCLLTRNHKQQTDNAQNIKITSFFVNLFTIQDQLGWREELVVKHSKLRGNKAWKSGDRDALHAHVVLLEKCTCGKEPGGQLHSCLDLPLSPSSLEHCALCQPEEESGFHLFEGWGEDGYQLHLSGWGQGWVWIWGWWWWYIQVKQDKNCETPQVESSTKSSSRPGNDWRLFLKRVS